MPNAVRNDTRVKAAPAGIPGSAHGVRKIAATRAANAGATAAQLETIFGWQGGTMASLYTRAADRRRLALGAMHKLGGRQTMDEAATTEAAFYRFRCSTITFGAGCKL